MTMTSQNMLPIYERVRTQYLSRYREELEKSTRPPSNSTLAHLAEYITEKYHFNIQIKDEENKYVCVEFIGGPNRDQGTNTASDAISEMMEILNLIYNYDFGDLWDYDNNEENGSYTFEMEYEIAPIVIAIKEEKPMAVSTKKQKPSTPSNDENLSYKDFIALKDIKNLVHDIQDVYELIKDNVVKEEFLQKTLDLFKKYRDEGEDPADSCEELLADICEQHGKEAWCKKIIKKFS